MTPLVTVLTPTYRQRPDILRRAVDSVRSQTLTDWQHVVCSDGVAEPEVEALVADLADPRIRYCVSRARHADWGAGVRAELLPQVSSSYVAFLDSDNIVFPRFLQDMVEALDGSPGAGFAVCAVLHFGPLPAGHAVLPEVLPGEFRVGAIDTLQVVARTQAMRACGWTTGDYCADGLTYVRLAEMFGHVRVPHVLGAHL